jgi:hypothetical protein
MISYHSAYDTMQKALRLRKTLNKLRKEHNTSVITLECLWHTWQKAVHKPKAGSLSNATSSASMSFNDAEPNI